MSTAIYGLLSLAFFIAFMGSLISRADKNSEIKVGDTFGHTNAGRSDDPSKPDAPFAAIYTVEEIRGDKARLHWITTNNPQGYDTWRSISDVGMFDDKLSKPSK